MLTPQPAWLDVSPGLRKAVVRVCLFIHAGLFSSRVQHPMQASVIPAPCPVLMMCLCV